MLENSHTNRTKIAKQLCKNMDEKKLRQFAYQTLIEIMKKDDNWFYFYQGATLGDKPDV